MCLFTLSATNYAKQGSCCWLDTTKLNACWHWWACSCSDPVYVLFCIFQPSVLKPSFPIVSLVSYSCILLAFHSASRRVDELRLLLARANKQHETLNCCEKALLLAKTEITKRTSTHAKTRLHEGTNICWRAFTLVTCAKHVWRLSCFAFAFARRKSYSERNTSKRILRDLS